MTADVDSVPRHRIRAYRDDDRDAVMAMAPRLTERVGSWRDPDAVFVAVTEWVADSLRDVASENRAVFVAEIDDRVVGAVTVGTRTHFTGEVDAYVGELVVDPAAAHAGVGTDLMAAAQDWGRSHGLTRLTLETGAANQAARHFYTNLGYREADVRLTRRL